MIENSKKICDLHLHSFYSDGSLSPQELVEEALKRKVFCISITDHDSIKAIKELKDANYPDCLKLIEGVELTASYQDNEVHILGYLVNSESDYLNKGLAEAYQVRQIRFREMSERLVLQGLRIDKESLFKSVKNITPTRLHLAKYLFKTRQVNSIYEAFKRYLNPERPGYICRSRFSLKEAIDFIHRCRGLAFLAHPHKLANQDWIARFVSFGIDGLEVSYPTMSSQERSFYKRYALKNKLLLSGGSDFHQFLNKSREIGSVDVPYKWVVAMEKRRKKIIESKKAVEIK
ncbi:MAG: PHP domain-containing protein [Candidatus Omnitrophica bacterium]|nr:PHP domain-containing protein [Candidatus Omnitrophota bacterium]MCF7876923.1 PHP domain-containing protein [Candidatus Omnitrophota bacterium]MCF7878603.1 PHP domain-containing protein [Candidatus Omnitrophota bacterium]MCF7893076.1 PHP domain-containing protein [Candidatus Omnitrophota bacterium]